MIFKTTEIRIPSIVPRVQLFHWIIPTLQPLTRSQFSPGFISFCSDWSRVILQLCLQIYHVNVNIGLHPRSFGMETFKLWLVAPGESDQELCLSGRRVWPKNPWADRHTILEQTCHHQRGSPGHILLSRLKKEILRKSILINYFKWSSSRPVFERQDKKNSCWVHLYIVISRFLNILILWCWGGGRWRWRGCFVILIFRLSSGCISHQENESERSTSLFFIVNKQLLSQVNKL